MQSGIEYGSIDGVGETQKIINDASNRAVGQHLRNISVKGEIDPLTLLAIKVIDQALRDARELRSFENNRRFQPGTKTNPLALEAERQMLLDWLDNMESGGFEYWAVLAEMSYKEMEFKQAEIREVLTGGEEA